LGDEALGRIAHSVAERLLSEEPRVRQANIHEFIARVGIDKKFVRIWAPIEIELTP